MVIRAPVEDIDMRSARAIIWSQVIADVLVEDMEPPAGGLDMVFCAKAGIARQSAVAQHAIGILGMTMFSPLKIPD